VTFDQIKETADFLTGLGIKNPDAGIIVGTGLGNLTSRIEKEIEVDYSEIPHFPISTVEFHKGKLIYGNLSGKKVLAMQGRFHAYEGYTMQQITFPVRVMKLLGIKNLLISNASGSVNPLIKKGSLMLIDDHINLQIVNPLTGKNFDELGPRFPDMSQPYNKDLNQKLAAIAEELDIVLHKGVYAAVQGPNLETRAEYRFLRIIGVDAVGMSTVPEVIVARQMHLPCFAVSVITDLGVEGKIKHLTIVDVLAAAAKAEPNLTLLTKELVARIPG